MRIGMLWGVLVLGDGRFYSAITFFPTSIISHGSSFFLDSLCNKAQFMRAGKKFYLSRRISRISFLYLRLFYTCCIICILLLSLFAGDIMIAIGLLSGFSYKDGKTLKPPIGYSTFRVLGI